MGSKTLKELYEDPKLDIQNIGESIGRWLARLHTSTTNDEVKRPFDHPVAKSMYRWNYNNLSSVLLKYGFDPTLGERINTKYGALLQTDDVCICHGDMWPGNVLFPDFGTGEEKLNFAIIDWEVARLGNGVTDVGHFAGEVWFLDRLRGGRGLLGAFLVGYVGERKLGPGERVRVAAQFGTHVTFWPTIYVSLGKINPFVDIQDSLILFPSSEVDSYRGQKGVYRIWELYFGESRQERLGMVQER